MFTDSMGQEFSKSAVETACLCCTVSGAFNQEYFKARGDSTAGSWNYLEAFSYPCLAVDPAYRM